MLDLQQMLAHAQESRMREAKSRSVYKLKAAFLEGYFGRDQAIQTPQLRIILQLHVEVPREHAQRGSPSGLAKFSSNKLSACGRSSACT